MPKIEIGRPPENVGGSVPHYNRGYTWGKDAKNRYGFQACQDLLRKYQHPANSYEAGVFDAIDGKANRYENG